MKKILMIIVIIALTACGKTEKVEVKAKAKEVFKSVESVELKLTKEQNIKNYNGEFLPLNEVTHITETGGNIEKVNYKNGDIVKKGDIIMILEDSDTRSTYMEANGDLTKSQSDYDTKKISYNKYKTLFDKKLISEDSYLTVKNQLLESQGNLEIANAVYIKAREDYTDLVVKAKISGTITDLDLKNYEKTIKDQELFTIIDTSKMEIAIGVSANDVRKIAVGTSVELSVAGDSVEGEVEKINYSSDTETKTYETKVIVENREGNLLKGMYSKVNINMGEIEGYFVPKGALMLEDMYNYIAISRDGKAIIYKVELGISTEGQQQIFLEDVEEGDRVIVQGQYLLKNNDSLKEV